MKPHIIDVVPVSDGRVIYIYGTEEIARPIVRARIGSYLYVISGRTRDRQYLELSWWRFGGRRVIAHGVDEMRFITREAAERFAADIACAEDTDAESDRIVRRIMQARRLYGFRSSRWGDE